MATIDKIGSSAIRPTDASIIEMKKKLEVLIDIGHVPVSSVQQSDLDVVVDLLYSYAKTAVLYADMIVECDKEKGIHYGND